MSKDKYFERVEAYFEKKCSPEEEIRFLEEAKSNKELQQAIKKYELTLEAVDLLSEDVMREKFKKWRREKAREEASPKIVDFRNISLRIFRMPVYLRYLAASFILLIFAYGTYYWFESRNLQEDYFVSLNQPLAAEMIRSDQDSLFLEAMEAYRNKDFELAISAFSSLSSSSDEVCYFMGHAYYLRKDYFKAEAQFQKIIEADESSYKEEAEWALLATYYKSNNKEDFEVLLNHILENGQHSSYDEAKNIEAGLIESSK